MGFHSHHADSQRFGFVPQYDLQPFVFAFISLFFIGYLVKSFDETIMIFPLSEIDFLFATPVSSRIIVGVKLFKLYIVYGLLATFLGVMMWPSIGMMARSPDEGLLPIALLGLVMFIAFGINIGVVINLISTFRKEGKWWLAWVIKGIAWSMLVYAVITFGTMYRQTGEALSSIENTFMKPILLILLFPAKCASDLMIATLSGWRYVLGVETAILCIVAVLSFLMVLSRNENPYEPSLAISSLMASNRAAIRSGGLIWLKMRASKLDKRSYNLKLSLPPFGKGAWAIVWKNINIALRTWAKGYTIVLGLIATGLCMYRYYLGDQIDTTLAAILSIVGAEYFLMGTSMAL